MAGPIRVGIVGLGKIARAQHLPTIARSPDCELAATASLDSTLDGVPGFGSIEELIRSGIALDAVLKLSNGGNRLDGDGAGLIELGESEYPRLYRRFAELIRRGESDVDIAPLQLVADAFGVSRPIEAEPFQDTLKVTAGEAI